MRVNCAPSKCCVWPDIGRQRRGCAHIGRRNVCVSIVMSCLRSRLSFFLVRKKEAACDMSRSYSAWVGIALERSQIPCGYRHWTVHFGLARFFRRFRRSTGSRRNAGNEVGGAAEYIFTQSHRLCCAFRGEYAGAARPRLRQRVFDSLDSLHLARGNVLFTRRSPVRVIPPTSRSARQSERESSRRTQRGSVQSPPRRRSAPQRFRPARVG